MSLRTRWMCASVLLLLVVGSVPPAVFATHPPTIHHWQRFSAAIRQIPIRRMHSAMWLPRYANAYALWRHPAMTKVRPIQGAAGAPSNTCPPLLNQITSCDGSYGNTGWLILTSIWADAGGHIAQTTSKLNNTYFNLPPYNTVAYRQHFICQQIGRSFGLALANSVRNNRNTGSCMDATNDPDGGRGGASPNDPHNMHPNAHDYATVNAKHNHIGSILPGFGEAKEESAAMPQVAAAFNPQKLSELGIIVWGGSDGQFEQYERHFGQWTVTSFVTRAR
jgi:hypothetical protein